MDTLDGNEGHWPVSGYSLMMNDDDDDDEPFQRNIRL